MKLRTNYVVNGFLIFAIVGSLLFEVALLTSAQDDTDSASAGSGTGTSTDQFVYDASSKCVLHMKEFMNEKKGEFGQFINTHFQSKKPTSELIPTAVERFRQYRREVREELDRFLPLDRTSSQAASAERPSCEKAIQEDFFIMRELIRQHIMTNAYAKKSTRLLDKYKILNEKLTNLNFTIAQMYGYFGAISQKLPCYATKCVKG